jgi:hypothetical protein
MGHGRLDSYQAMQAWRTNLGLHYVVMSFMQISANEVLSSLSSSAAGLRLKEMEEQQQALLKSVVCGFNQLLDLRDLGTGS